jgi:dihydrodipicolinate synthase/N-acetylneuraminate lyase
MNTGTTGARVMVPVLTLRNADGSLDHTANVAYARRARNTWLDLFLVSGTIGGGEQSTAADRRALLERWVEQVPPARLLACVWTVDDLRHATECGVRPIVVLRAHPDGRSLDAFLADLPANAFVYSHPNYSPTTFSPAVATVARQAGALPAGGKICKVNLEEVAQLRGAVGEPFQLYDGRCRHLVRSIRAGATGVVAVPLATLPDDLPKREETEALQRTIDATQERIDSIPAGQPRIAMLTHALLTGALS